MPYKPTPIEEALAEFRTELLQNAAADVFEKHGVQRQMTKEAFKRLLILHLHGLDLRSWCEAFGLPPSLVDGKYETLTTDGAE